FTSRGECPLGNAVATLAILTWEPARHAFAAGTRLGYTHTAAHGPTDASRSRGDRAFLQSWRTLPGVSRPSRVVRSIMRTASRRPAPCAVFLMDRFASAAARSSTATWSTGGGGG